MRSSERKSSTGRDNFIMIEALATAIIAMEQMSPEWQPTSNMEDMKILLSVGASARTVSLMLAQAKCRIRPDLDSVDIFREYGIVDEE
jgi:hypothetical protein